MEILNVCRQIMNGQIMNSPKEFEIYIAQKCEFANLLNEQVTFHSKYDVRHHH